MSTPNESSCRTCPYLAQYCPSGRAHTYHLCEATGAEPYVPSQRELVEVCRADYTQCVYFKNARDREVRAA